MEGSVMRPGVHWPVGMGVGVVDDGVGVGVVEVVEMVDTVADELGVDERARDTDRVERVTTLVAGVPVSVMRESEKDASAAAEELATALETELLLAGTPSHPRKNELNRVEKGPDCETDLKRVQSAEPASASSAANCTATHDESAVQAATHSSADISRTRLVTVEPD
jgi:hypothetical protein